MSVPAETPAAPAAPAAAPTTPATTTATAPAASPEEILAAVLEIVAAQTGYPADMLDPELDLEADLGIDTVKQAEMFAAIRERYGIDRDDNLKLRDYPTLRHVAGFVEDNTGAPAPVADAEPEAAPAADEVPEPVADPAPADNPAFPRRVPVPVLRPPLERCGPTNVQLGEGSRVIVAPDTGGVAAALTGRLRKLGVEVITRADGGKVDGVFWLPGLDVEPAELDAAGWHDGLAARVKRLAELMRELPETAFLVSGTRLGGRHGYDAAGAASVMGGAVSGFTKALSRERPDTLIKVVDFERSRKSAEPAERLLGEALSDPGAVEIGYADGLRWTIAVVEQPVADARAMKLTPETTFVVTGAAGSIVSAIVTDLTRAAGGGTFHLLDLAEAPPKDDQDVARFSTDREGLKRDLVERERAAGGKPTPKTIEQALARIERSAEARAALDAIEAAGGSAHWHAVNLTDAGAVSAALQGAGKVDALIHAAGLEISHPLPKKPQKEYDLVFDVKADGWFNLISALDEPPKAVVVFSSIAGRFGNSAQTDYSAANDLLCKAISNMRRDGVTRGIAIDWTAWAGIGMATRGSIPKIMEMAGIEMLPPEVGVPIVRRELERGGGEIIAAGKLGIMLDETPQDIEIPSGPMSGTTARITINGGLELETELDPTRQGFLFDHRIDGTAVLPGVMGMEAFVEAAAALAPGYTVTTVEDVDLRSPFKFYRDEPRAPDVIALVRDDGDGRLVADCRLVGRRTLASGEVQETLHFTGRVRLAREPLPAPHVDPPPTSPDGMVVVGHDDLYRVYFHGPAYQVLQQAYRRNGDVIGLMADNLPPNHEADMGPTQLVPRLIELCFQTAGVWEIGTVGRMALPTRVARLERYAGADAPGRLTALVRPRPDGVIDAEVVDESGTVRIKLEGYTTTVLPAPLDEASLAPLRAVVEGGAA